MPNAINIPIYELEVQIDSIVKSKKDKIIVYCTKGIRSKEAVKILNNKGYINVYRIKDGIDF